MVLLLDRAPWHQGPAIDQLLADNSRLELVYFPPACPELNRQEPVWEQAREVVGHNHEYTRFETLIDTFDAFLNEPPSLPIS